MRLNKVLMFVLCVSILFIFTGCARNDLTAQVDIKGEIIEITQDQTDNTTVILVEDKIESNTPFDNANVTINKKTKIFRGNTNELLSVNDLKQGTHVEVIFTGPVAESYPVQATAKIIRVVEPNQQKVSKSEVTAYFPFKENVHMVYKGIGNEYAEYETYVDYVKDNIIQIRNSNPGTTSVFVYKFEDGVLKRVFNQQEMYYKHDYTTFKNDDEIILKEPIKVGTSWTTKSGGTRVITSVAKTVSTPAGVFDAIEITTEDVESTTTDYYAKNIGHIKSTYKSKSDPAFAITSELERIEENTPLKQNIRFFYPEFLQDRIVFIDKDLEFATNQDIIPLLLKELQQVPEDSGLTPVLSQNTKILNVLLDEGNDAVTVDFSQHLVDEMNAGTSLESMLLKSIANTFGTYYQKQKIFIMVEGKPYESGHILMKPEEFLTIDMTDVVSFE